MNIKITAALVAACVVAGCAGVVNHEQSGAAAHSKRLPQDGELALPADYKNWPVFAAHIDKEKGRQVRDIYINTRGARVQKGDKFPHGTQFVMALYQAQQNADGSLMRALNGSLVKGALSKVFIMEKGPNWGDGAPAGLKNGDWIYAAYNGDGSKAMSTTMPVAAVICRTAIRILCSTTSNISTTDLHHPSPTLGFGQ